MSHSIQTVLIVEDQKQLADGYAEALSTEYETITTYSGAEALEAADKAVDAVFLDRRMPDLSGGEVLEQLRSRGYDYPVAMITAVSPDWDIVEMGFDDYLIKPVQLDELHDAVKRLETLGAIDREAREYIRQNIKQATLEGEKDASRLEDSEEFEALKTDVSDRSTEIGDITAELSRTETELIIETISRNLGPPK